MPSYSLDTSSSDEYDADDCELSGKNSKGKGFDSAEESGEVQPHTPKRCRLRSSKKKNAVQEEKQPVTQSRMKLRSNSKNKKGKDVIPSRSRKVTNLNYVLNKSPNVTSRKNNKNKTTPTPLNAPATPAAHYPPRLLKLPSKCPISAIQHPLPLSLVDYRLDSNQLFLTKFKEPLSNVESPPISPGIVLVSQKHSTEDEDNAKDQIKQLSPTPFKLTQPMSVIDDEIPDAPYSSRNKLFAGTTDSPDPRAEDLNGNFSEAAADKRRQAHMSPELTQLSDELSRVNFKTTEAQCKAPVTNGSYKSALDDGAITRHMQILLDLSYLRSGIQLKNFATANAHRKRIMIILDNPSRAKLLISMILRNNNDIDLMDLIREFDYFSF